MANKKYNVVIDVEKIQENFAEYSPFNLERDIKNQKLEENDLQNIACSIADEMYYGFDRKSCIAVYWGKKRKANYAKVRVVDLTRSGGKSSGFRCIVLVDEVNCYGYLLHIYRHGHGEKDNISRKEQNKLEALVEAYINSIE